MKMLKIFTELFPKFHLLGHDNESNNLNVNQILVLSLQKKKKKKHLRYLLLPLVMYHSRSEIICKTLLSRLNSPGVGVFSI